MQLNLGPLHSVHVAGVSSDRCLPNVLEGSPLFLQIGPPDSDSDDSVRDPARLGLHQGDRGGCAEARTPTRHDATLSHKKKKSLATTFKGNYVRYKDYM